VELGWRARRLEVPLLYEPRAVSYQVYRKTFRGLCENIRHAGAADLLMAAEQPEIAPFLLLGRGDELPRGQRWSLHGTRAAPAAARLVAAPLLAVLGLAERRGWTSVFWEHLHGVARCHLYGLGMLDGERAAAASRRTA
jgi:hypothetical protein